MIILISGDRYWDNADIIKRELEKFLADTVIIHGAAKGADTIAGIVAKNLGMRVIPFKADWLQYGKAAGPIRNKQMIDEGKPDLLLAFHSHIETSKGTADMIQRAKKANIKTILITDGGDII